MPKHKINNGVNMNTVTIIFIICATIIALFSFRRVKARYILLSALCGICSLFAVDFLASFIEINIPVNFFTIGMGCAGGIPGIILLIVLMTFM